MSAVAQRSLDAEDVEERHHELLASYVAALDAASERPRYIARKLLESHVKRRLEVLSAVYAQHALLETDRERYDRLATDARSFADTLPSWRLTTWLALFPILVVLAGPIGAAVTGISFDRWQVRDAGDAAMGVIYAGGLVVYVGGLLPRAFRRKRSYLLPDEADPDGRNAYRCEEAVFGALGRGRPVERSLDYILGALVAGLVFLLSPILVILAALPFVDDARDIPTVLLLAGYVVSGAAAVWLQRHWSRRRWR